MKSKLIVFLLLMITIVGCGNAPDEKNQDQAPLSSPSTNDDNGENSPSSDVNNQDEDGDEDEDEDEDNDNKKDKKDND